MFSTLMYEKTFVVYVMEMVVLVLLSVILQQGLVKQVSLSNTISEQYTILQLSGYVDVGVIPIGAREITIRDTSNSSVIGNYIDNCIKTSCLVHTSTFSTPMLYE